MFCINVWILNHRSSLLHSSYLRKGVALWSCPWLRAECKEGWWLISHFLLCLPSYLPWFILFQGYDDLVASNVASRRACEELCLESVDLPCRSAEYDYKNFVCKLSTETRRTQPTAYRYTDTVISKVKSPIIRFVTTTRCAVTLSGTCGFWHQAKRPKSESFRLLIAS